LRVVILIDGDDDDVFDDCIVCDPNADAVFVLDIIDDLLINGELLEVLDIDADAVVVLVLCPDTVTPDVLDGDLEDAIVGDINADDVDDLLLVGVFVVVWVDVVVLVDVVDKDIIFVGLILLDAVVVLVEVLDVVDDIDGITYDKSNFLPIDKLWLLIKLNDNKKNKIFNIPNS